MSELALRLDNIQGNIFGGFNKDFQNFLFVRFTSASGGRIWLKTLLDSDEVGLSGSTSADVLKFNGEFKALKAQGLKPEDFIAAAWTNVALSFAGLTALGVGSHDRDAFPEAFRQGMAARKATIGDVGTSDPATWAPPFAPDAGVHAIVLLAADDEAMLAERTDAVTATFGAAVVLIDAVVEGRTRLDVSGEKRAGHEHFGFKDGVSQPGIRGVTPPDDPIGNPDQGQPGQDLLWPGEFVLGYPTQLPHHKPGVDGPNPNPGPHSHSGPSWTRDGSYLVFRRLRQDVPAFDQQIGALAASTGLSEDLVGAKLVGRYKSGCPLETRTFQAGETTPSSTDPGIAVPALADSDSLNNDFEFGDDPDGAICPIAAHIRKAYPRDEQTAPNAADSESITQTHRLLRRGIPFGGSIGDTKGGGVDDPRGLLFLCYQRSLTDGFEFVQRSWVDDPEFPGFPAGRPTPGQDPIIAQSQQGPFQIAVGEAPISVKHFVTTTGGEYFFAPSMKALKELGDGLHA